MQGFACCEHLNRNPNSVVTGVCGCVLFNFLWIREGKSKPHPLQKRKTQRMRHLQIPFVPSVDVRCELEG
jgi:hypothetical protein